MICQAVLYNELDFTKLPTVNHMLSKVTIPHLSSFNFVSLWGLDCFLFVLRLQDTTSTSQILQISHYPNTRSFYLNLFIYLADIQTHF